MLPAVQAAREAARRMQCTNHVKQISLGLHNFADVYRELLPSDTYAKSSTGDDWSGVGLIGSGTTPTDRTAGEERVSVLVHLLPYVEQSALYEGISRESNYIVSGSVLNTAVTATATGSLVLTAGSAPHAVKNAKINYFTCPSGNHPDKGATPFVASYTGIGGSGPTSGITVATTGTTAVTTAMISSATPPVVGVTVTGDVLRASDFSGALPAGKPGTLKMPDGTSNSIVFSEVGSRAVGANVRSWYRGGSATATPDSVSGITSVYGVKLFFTATAAGNGKLLNRKVSASDKSAWNLNSPLGLGSWGSNHTNAVVFGLGDGSVRTISESIQDGVIFRLANISDGVAVALP